MLFVDMDGVLADFDAHYEAMFGVRPDKHADDVDWDLVRSVPDFYLNIPLMSDASLLWERVRRHEPTILTGVPRSVSEAPHNKRSWVIRNLGSSVPVICCPSRDKSMYANPGDVLVDDWEKYKHLWVGVGGRWITHTSAIETIRQLDALGF